MTARSASPVWRPFTQHALQSDAISIARAEGAWLETSDGARVLDAISSWWVITHGHRHPKIMQAIRDQTERLDQIIFAGYTHEPAERLARRLVEMTPVGLDYVFYSDSGSTCVEVAIKMALGLLAQSRRSAYADYCVGAWLSWRHDWRDVDGRALSLQRRL